METRQKPNRLRLFIITALSLFFNLGLFAQTYIDSVSVQDVSCFGGSDGEIILHLNLETEASNYIYEWENSTSEDSIAQNLSAGNYSVIIRNTIDDISDTLQNIIVSEPEPIIINIDEIISVNCGESNNGSITVLPTGGTGLLTINWSNGSTDTEITSLESGTYFITITDENQCVLVDSMDVSLLTDLELNLNSTPVSCFNASDGILTTSVTGGTGSYDISWSTGSNLSTINNLPADLYTVTVYDSNSPCTSIESINLENPEELIFSFIETIQSCPNESDGIIEMIVSGGVGEIEYFLNGEESTFENLIADTYTISAIDENNCTIDSLIFLESYPDLQIEIIASPEYLEIDNPPNGYIISWTPVESITSPNSFTTSIIPVENTTYTATLTSPEGCIYQNSITVDIATIEGAIMPSAFTPDNNGENDIFKPLRTSDVISEFIIFDRNGKMIFESTNEGWDGTYNNEPLPSDTYIYVVKFENLPDAYSGSITLIR